MKDSGVTCGVVRMGAGRAGDDSVFVVVDLDGSASGRCAVAVGTVLKRGPGWPNCGAGCP